MSDSLGFVGGGLTECSNFLKSRYEYLHTLGIILGAFGVCCLSFIGGVLLAKKLWNPKNITKRNDLHM